MSGVGRLIMLVAEPGIGKTRTAQELATYARLRGAQILWGRCHEECPHIGPGYRRFVPMFGTNTASRGGGTCKSR